MVHYIFSPSYFASLFVYDLMDRTYSDRPSANIFHGTLSSGFFSIRCLLFYVLWLADNVSLHDGSSLAPYGALIKYLYGWISRRVHTDVRWPETLGICYTIFVFINRL